MKTSSLFTSLLFLAASGWAAQVPPPGPLAAAAAAPARLSEAGAVPLAVPSAPIALRVLSLGDELHFTWVDTSNNENEFRFEFRDPGGSFSEFGSVSKNSTAAVSFPNTPNITRTYRIRARNNSGNSGYSNEVIVNHGPPTGLCGPSGIGICLNGGRFRFIASYRTSAHQVGPAHGIAYTNETGLEWFFSSANIEMLVKVLDGCGLNDRYWVFAGGLTNVGVFFNVVDTQTGESFQGGNPVNREFAPLLHTSAFATCP